MFGDMYTKDAAMYTKDVTGIIRITTPWRDFYRDFMVDTGIRPGIIILFFRPKISV